MKLYNTMNYPEFIERLIVYCNRHLASCYDYSMRANIYRDALLDINTKPIYFAYDESKNCIAALLSSYQRFGVTVWTADTNDLDAVAALQDAYPELFFFSGDGYYLNKSNMFATACCASYNTNVTYPSIANACIWTNKEEHVNDIRDWLENKYLKSAEDWQNCIEYKWIHAKEFAKIIYDKDLMDYPWRLNEYGHYAYIGFHYMNWESYPENAWYLMAMVDNKPIGCICINKYEQYGYYGLSYIDVAFPYKNNGVAKKMIHELTKVIPGDMPLLLSMESKEGEKCHIHECFKREKWPNAAVTQDEFDEMCRKKKRFSFA